MPSPKKRQKLQGATGIEGSLAAKGKVAPSKDAGAAKGKAAPSKDAGAAGAPAGQKKLKTGSPLAGQAKPSGGGKSRPPQKPLLGKGRVV